MGGDGLDRDVCEALIYAHQMCDESGRPLNLIHRDLKPSNIFVTQEGKAKLIDFGIAKTSNSMFRTKTGILKGTPSYMSPEQITSKGMDHRSDLFSLGCVLYELCAGTPPFVANELLALIFLIMSETPKPFPIENGIPAGLEKITFRLLEKAADHRYTSAQELLGDLTALMPQQETSSVRALYQELMEQHAAHTLQENDLATGELYTPHTYERTEEFLGPPVIESSEPGELLYERASEKPPWRSAGIAGLLILCAGILGAFALFRMGTWSGSSLPPKQPVGRALGPTIRNIPQRPPLRPRPTAKRPQKPKARRTTAPTNNPQPPLRRSPASSGKRRRKARRTHLLRKRFLRVAKAATKYKTRTSPPALPKEGAIHFDIAPTCRLFEGETFLGHLGKLRLKRPPGRYHFRCINAGLHFMRKWSIEVAQGQTKRWQKRYAMGSIFVLSFPWADIYLPPFGKLGTSQKLIKLPQGQYSLVLYQKGNPKVKKVIQVSVYPDTIVRPRVRWKK